MDWELGCKFAYISVNSCEADVGLRLLSERGNSPLRSLFFRHCVRACAYVLWVSRHVSCERSYPNEWVAGASVVLIMYMSIRILASPLPRLATILCILDGNHRPPGQPTPTHTVPVWNALRYSERGKILHRLDRARPETENALDESDSQGGMVFVVSRVVMVLLSWHLGRYRIALSKFFHVSLEGEYVLLHQPERGIYHLRCSTNVFVLKITSVMTNLGHFLVFGCASEQSNEPAWVGA